MSTRSVGKPTTDQSRIEPRSVPVERDKPRLNDTRKVKPRVIGDPTLGNRPSGGSQKEPKKPSLNKNYMQKREVPVQKMIEAELAEFSIRDMFRGRTRRALPIRGDAVAYHVGPQGITVAHVRDGYIVDRQVVASAAIAKQQAQQAKQAWMQAKADLLNLHTNQRGFAKQKAVEYAKSLNLPRNVKIGEYDREIPVFGMHNGQNPQNYTRPNTRGYSGSVPNSSPGGGFASPPSSGNPPPRSGFEPGVRPSRSYPNAAPIRNSRDFWRNRGATPRNPSGPQNLKPMFGDMGKGITGSLYDGLFDALSKGQTKFAGIEDPILKKARPYFDAGLIKSPDDLRAFLHAKIDPSTGELRSTPPTGDSRSSEPSSVEGEKAPANGPTPMERISMKDIDEILRHAHASGADKTRKTPKGYWSDAMIAAQGELTKRHAALKFIQNSKANTNRTSDPPMTPPMNEWGWPRQPPMAISDDQIHTVIQQVRSLGIRCRYNEGKFMVNYPAGKSSSAFFTSNPEQAIAMAQRMSRVMDAHASQMQEGYPDTTYEREEPAHEARVGGLQLRGRMTDPGMPKSNRDFMQARDLHIERIHEIARREIDQLLRSTARKLGFNNIVIEQESEQVTVPRSAEPNVELPRVRRRWVGEGGHLPQPKRPLPSNIAGTGKDFRAKPGTNRAKKQPGPLVGKAMKAKPGFIG